MPHSCSEDRCSDLLLGPICLRLERTFEPRQVMSALCQAGDTAPSTLFGGCRSLFLSPRRSECPCDMKIEEVRMHLPRRKFLHLVAGAAALPAVPRVAWAQAYPARPITIVVPFPAGGSTDVIGRILAEKMRAILGQTIIIENVGGAGGSIGVGRVARASPDGYTLDIGQWDTHVANGAMYPLSYNLQTGFEPIALISSNPFLILGKRDMPGNDLKGLVAWLKANPDKASAAVPTAGTQVASALFQKESGTRFVVVPYRGGGPAMQDLVAGHIDMMLIQAAVALPQLRSGAIKAYAVMASGRFAAAQNIPTVDEAGLPGLHISGWFGLYAPKGTPRAVIDKLNAALVDALADATVRSRLADVGQEIPPREQQTPEALGAFTKAEIEKWWPIIKAANLKGE
jgi:tripartite-type tricarboxylate transporter receptor subunit TctC